MKQIDAGVLSVAFDEQGSRDGTPVVLLHGFPYDIHAYDEVTPRLAAAGCRVITPFLRGYGATRFLSSETPRSGQQAVLAHDLLALMDALALPDAVLAGYDWGGRAACIVAALWPERARGLVSGGGYNVHNVPGSREPMAPADEHRLWYQYYLHGERGRLGLNATATRSASCSGSSGRRTGISTMRPTIARPLRSRTRTSLPSWCILIGSASGWRPAIPRSKRPNGSS